MATTATDLISTTINDLEAAVYSYSAVQGDKALHAAIHEGGRNLFLVGRALEAAKTELGGRDLAGDADASSTMDLLKQCKVNAELSKIIFNAVALAPEASRSQRYKEVVRQEGDGRTVEVLVMGMINDVRLLAENDAVRAGIQDQVNALREAIGRLSAMESSVPGEASSYTFTNYGSGDVLSAPGGTINNSTGTGNHFPGASFFGTVSF
ncbi:hypothetical protein H9Q72_001599 [Fusarium xylarioides]|uniref:NACHT-NTPase and P-loop NTPases N-terminal domain-containing protein n=1 Tax=Fusarium xylarioides TaxID=221167 RepID=A0A9P7LA73_9HYPO|nr:hypothetical protein H9Q72_001599 [Fusarium xylarioides]KAG5813460.1 hypothetical protein H9Q71_003756 [Fusarium xylarioides]KAG5826865.1 hypothetical protein H9Q74_003054 [Fusarium xylarioides]